MIISFSDELRHEAEQANSDWRYGRSYWLVWGVEAALTFGGTEKDKGAETVLCVGKKMR
jgi:hypothetical protein